MQQLDVAPVPGRDLRDRRKKLGVSQKSLAAALAMDRVTLYRWEQADLVPYLPARRYIEALLRLATGAACPEGGNQ